VDEVRWVGGRAGGQVAGGWDSPPLGSLYAHVHAHAHLNMALKLPSYAMRQAASSTGVCRGRASVEAEPGARLS
jgi:hypothetical protein